MMKRLSLILILLLLTSCDDSKKHEVQQIDDVQGNQTELEQEKDKSPAFILNEIIEKAKRGLVKGSAFNVLDSEINQVKEKWGEPDSVDRAGSGYYATYKKEGITFGYNEKGEIFDVRSYSKELNNLAFTDIEEVAGSPKEKNEYNNDYIYTYEVTSDIQLKFVGPKNSGKVDHISVFNQKRTILLEDPYLLEIKGKSNQLSSTAWTSMQNWRKQIVNFSSGQENVFINGPNKKMVALTFDDGPDTTTTLAIIDILDEYNVTGNFFFVGSNVEKHPEIVREAYEKGNLIFSHSYNHIDLAKLTKGELLSQMEKADMAIEEVIGKRSAMLRPPYGETDELVAAVAKEQGYSIVLWSIDTLDWSQKEASNIVKNVIDNGRNGDIILMHSTEEQSETKKALPLIIEELQKRDFEIVGLDELLNVKAYK
jgi:peptidoglycan/xylan/chitin deacetylase (PgdA/CDA1 family)